MGPYLRFFEPSWGKGAEGRDRHAVRAGELWTFWDFWAEAARRAVKVELFRAFPRSKSQRNRQTWLVHQALWKFEILSRNDQTSFSSIYILSCPEIKEPRERTDMPLVAFFESFPGFRAVSQAWLRGLYFLMFLRSCRRREGRYHGELWSFEQREIALTIRGGWIVFWTKKRRIRQTWVDVVIIWKLVGIQSREPDIHHVIQLLRYWRIFQVREGRHLVRIWCFEWKDKGTDRHRRSACCFWKLSKVLSIGRQTSICRSKSWDI